MAFTKESAAKAGAKSSRKGTPNKDTRVLRERIEDLLDNQWDQILKDVSKLSPKERIDMMIRLLEYALPKLTRAEIKETSTVEELLAMTPQQRRARIAELKQNISKENNNGWIE